MGERVSASVESNDSRPPPTTHTLTTQKRINIRIRSVQIQNFILIQKIECKERFKAETLFFLCFGREMSRLVLGGVTTTHPLVFNVQCSNFGVCVEKC